VHAQQAVLALGGLETARLLLASDDVTPQGVGNDHDVVGRFYMCHLAANLGQLQVHGNPDTVRHGYERSSDGVYCRRRLTLAERTQHEQRLLNTVARLHFPRIADPVHGSGVLSLLYLARACISYEYGRRLQDDAPTGLRSTLSHAGNVLRDGVGTLRFLAHWIWQRELAARKFPSVILPNTRNRFSLELQAEQVPHPDSRITLARARDRLGQPRLRIDWRYQLQDIDSVQRSMEIIATELARSGSGHLTWNASSLPQDLLRYGAYGGHHLGTARMGADPRSSVVDADGRVHGLDNLYIAGSAVFPTSSQANPTLTALALALRLADHLEPAAAPPDACAPAGAPGHPQRGEDLRVMQP
jgi:choline dehydrogenase-like flavoprotein